MQILRMENKLRLRKQIEDKDRGAMEKEIQEAMKDELSGEVVAEEIAKLKDWMRTELEAEWKDDQVKRIREEVKAEFQARMKRAEEARMKALEG